MLILYRFLLKFQIRWTFPHESILSSKEIFLFLHYGYERIPLRSSHPPFNQSELHPLRFFSTNCEFFFYNTQILHLATSLINPGPITNFLKLVLPFNLRSCSKSELNFSLSNCATNYFCSSFNFSAGFQRFLFAFVQFALLIN